MLFNILWLAARILSHSIKLPDLQSQILFRSFRQHKNLQNIKLFKIYY